jgi:hypothetical protein
VGGIRVARALRDEVGANARDSLAVELVGQKCLESIGQGVNPENPAQPRVHLRLLNHITGIHDERGNQESRHLRGSIECREEGTDGSEESSHTLLRN